MLKITVLLFFSTLTLTTLLVIGMWVQFFPATLFFSAPAIFTSLSSSFLLGGPLFLLTLVSAALLHTLLRQYCTKSTRLSKEAAANLNTVLQDLGALIILAALAFAGYNCWLLAGSLSLSALFFAGPALAIVAAVLWGVCWYALSLNQAFIKSTQKVDVSEDANQKLAISFQTFTPSPSVTEEPKPQPYKEERKSELAFVRSKENRMPKISEAIIQRETENKGLDAELEEAKRHVKEASDKCEDGLKALIEKVEWFDLKIRQQRILSSLDQLSERVKELEEDVGDREKQEDLEAWLQP